MLLFFLSPTCHQSNRHITQISIKTPDMHAKILALFLKPICCLRWPFERAGLSAVSQAVCVSFGPVSLFCAHSDPPPNGTCSAGLPVCQRRAPQTKLRKITVGGPFPCRGLICIGKTWQGKEAIIENGFMRDPSWIKESASHNVALLCSVQVSGYEDCTEGVWGSERAIWILTRHSFFTIFRSWKWESCSCFSGEWALWNTMCVRWILKYRQLVFYIHLYTAAMARGMLISWWTMRGVLWPCSFKSKPNFKHLFSKVEEVRFEDGQGCETEIKKQQMSENWH